MPPTALLTVGVRIGSTVNHIEQRGRTKTCPRLIKCGMICGFVTPSSWMVSVAHKTIASKWPRCPSGLRPRATTSAVNRMRTATHLPTATEAIVVDKHKVVAPPLPHQSLIGKKPPQFREAASPISGAGRRKIRRDVADHQYPWSSGGLGRRFTLVILRVQVSEHGEYTEMQRVYVASLAAMSTQREYRRSLPFFLTRVDKNVIIVCVRPGRSR